MARVTIERTLDKIDTRFELVVLASYRAHAIHYGSQVSVASNNKYAVQALREIEAGNIDVEELKRVLIEQYKNEIKFSINNSNSFIKNDYSVRNFILSEDKKKDNIEIDKNSSSEDKEVELNVSSNFFKS